MSDNKILTITNDGIAYSIEDGNNKRNFGFYSPKLAICCAILDNYFFAGTQEGLYTSNNNGITWKRHDIYVDTFLYLPPLLFSKSATINEIAVTLNGVFAATERGIYVSYDYGNSWKPTAINLFVQNLKASKNNISFTTTDVSGVHHFYLSTDGGVNWANKEIDSLEILNYDIFESRLFATTVLGGYLSEDLGNTWVFTGPLPATYVGSVAINQTDILLGIRNTGVYKAENNGTSWQYLGLANKGDYYNVKIDEDNYYCGTARGFFQTKNKGLNWEEVGFLVANINCLTEIEGKIFAGTDDRVFVTNDYGVSWTSIGMENIPIKFIKKLGGKVYMASFLGPPAFFSSDNGTSWTQFPIQLIYTFDKNNSKIFAAGEGLYSSSDDGDTWSSMPGLEGKSINYIKTKGDTIYVSTFSPQFEWYQSNDNGNTWEKKGDGIILGIHGNDIYIRGFQTDLYSKNSGATFENIELPEPIKFMEFKENLLFIGTYDGLYVSIDKGLSLLKMNAGLENISSNDLIFTNDNIYLGTTQSVWKRPLSDILMLFNNDFNFNLFPNPGKDILEIQTTENVKEVNIFNVNGMKVSNYEISKYTNYIDVSSLSKGIYFVTAIGESKVKTIKFIKI